MAGAGHHPASAFASAEGGSIAGAAGRLPLVPLTVHYRSGHQSLIAVSNELFYNGTLTSFPSAHDLAPPDPRPPASSGRPRLALGPGSRREEGGGGGSGSHGIAGRHGLVREVVAWGRMESNGGRREALERFVAAAVEAHCPKALHRLHCGRRRGLSSLAAAATSGGEAAAAAAGAGSSFEVGSFEEGYATSAMAAEAAEAAEAGEAAAAAAVGDPVRVVYSASPQG